MTKNHTPTRFAWYSPTITAHPKYAVKAASLKEAILKLSMILDDTRANVKRRLAGLERVVEEV